MTFKWWHKRQLEKKLDNLLQCGRAHKANGLPPGSDEYKTLKSKADAAVQQYCELTTLPLNEVQAQIAGLRFFDDMTVSTVASKNNPLVLIVLAACVPLVAGACYGLFQAGHHIVAKMVGL